MRIGVHARHWQGSPHDVAELGRIAEGAGLDSIWVSETWGSDAVALATWIAAATTTIDIGTGVLQMAARTPVQSAMAALTLDHLSGGRFRLGLGVSGPQVVEGWHGAASDHPLARTREYVEIVRSVLRRDAPVEAPGPHYPLPRPGGEGKPLKANVRPLRADIPIYLAAMGPRNVALAGEVAEGWLPLLFSPDHADAFPIAELPDGFDVAPMALTAIDEDVAFARDAVRSEIARYVGAFGSRGTNFYADLVRRYGFERQVDAIQDAALDGRMADATAAAGDELVDTVALVGSVGRIRERLDAYEQAGVTTVLAMTTAPATVRALEEVRSA
jgi:F420-dependent oxidoreductase-like protein